LLTIFSFLFNLIRFSFQKDYSLKKKSWGYFWTLIIAMIVATMFTSALDTLYNWGFMIEFYNVYYQLAFDPNAAWILITIFWFNLIQSIINILIFSLFYKTAYTLLNLYFI
jgi:riboflavin transporter FmnP